MVSDLTVKHHFVYSLRRRKNRFCDAFFISILNNDIGAKSPTIDAYGLFRATHSHNPTQYSHIVGLSSIKRIFALEAGDLLDSVKSDLHSSLPA